MIEHHDLMDVLVAAFTFGNTVAGAIIGGIVMRRQTAQHMQNQAAIADVRTTMLEVHNK